MFGKVVGTLFLSHIRSFVRSFVLRPTYYWCLWRLCLGFRPFGLSVRSLLPRFLTFFFFDSNSNTKHTVQFIIKLLDSRWTGCRRCIRSGRIQLGCHLENRGSENKWIYFLNSYQIFTDLKHAGRGKDKPPLAKSINIVS